jgi:hypothetical protein
VQTLSTLYQKAIEYYSALDNLEQTTDYLERMRALMAREDIQIVLNSYEEESKNTLIFRLIYRGETIERHDGKT